MDYILNDIADISIKPQVNSLGESDNYIEFRSKVANTNNKNIKLIIIVVDVNVDIKDTAFTVRDLSTGNKYKFKGTKDKTRINNYTFFMDDDASVVASNIAECLNQNLFISSHYQVETSISFWQGDVKNANTISFRSYNYDSSSTFEILDYSLNFIVPDGDTATVIDKDTISNGYADCKIEISFYLNPAEFKNINDGSIPIDIDSLGEYMASVQKNYFGSPLWFNVNSILGYNTISSIDFLYNNNWVINDTVHKYRFIAKRTTPTNHQPFYLSDILYCYYGFTRGLETVDLNEYILDLNNKNNIKLLTKQPILSYSNGQTQYLNFLFKDNEDTTETSIGLRYILYTQSRRKIATVDAKQQNKVLFGMSNTVNIEIDSIINDYPKTGYIEVYLTVDDNIISNSLDFVIVPDGLNKVNDFAFINSLGGWSTLNFGGSDSTEFKSTVETFYKTKTPNTKISSSINTVFDITTDQTYTVTSDPITANMCEYYREIATSKYIYEIATKRYILIDEMTIKTSSKEELFYIDMKYRYTDKYSGQ